MSVAQMGKFSTGLQHTFLQAPVQREHRTLQSLLLRLCIFEAAFQSVMRPFVAIAITILSTVLAFGQTKRQLRKHLAPTKRQQKKEAINHECVYTSKYSAEQLRKFYPFDIAKSISIVSFESDSAFINTLPIVKGEIDYTQIRESKVLNTEQIDSLASIFYNVSYRGEIIWTSSAGCYNPRNAVLFFDSNNHLLEFIELCFECHGHRVSSDQITIGDDCSGKFAMIKAFFFKNGIRVGTLSRLH